MPPAPQGVPIPFGRGRRLQVRVARRGRWRIPLPTVAVIVAAPGTGYTDSHPTSTVDYAAGSYATPATAGTTDQAIRSTTEGNPR